MLTYRVYIIVPSSTDYETCTFEKFQTVQTASSVQQAKDQAIAWVQEGGFCKLAAVEKVSLV